MKSTLFLLIWLAVGPIHGQLTMSDSVSAYETDSSGTYTMVHLQPFTFVEQTLYYSVEEYRQFWRMRYYVTRVMPYAQQALQLMAATEGDLSGLQMRRQQRRYLRQAYNQLKEQYKDPLKQMYVEEGRVLIKIIERETGRTMYDIIKTYKGGDDAVFWQGIAKAYGYSLKDGYDPADEPILERILSAMEEPLD